MVGTLSKQKKQLCLTIGILLVLVAVGLLGYVLYMQWKMSLV